MPKYKPDFKLLHGILEFINNYGVDELLEDIEKDDVAAWKGRPRVGRSGWAAHKMLETIHDYGVEKFISELDGKKPIRTSKNTVKKKVARKLKFKKEAL